MRITWTQCLKQLFEAITLDTRRSSPSQSEEGDHENITPGYGRVYDGWPDRLRGSTPRPSIPAGAHRRQSRKGIKGKRGLLGRKESPVVAGIPMTKPAAQNLEQDRPLAWGRLVPARVKRTVHNRARAQAMDWNQGPIRRRMCGPADRRDRVARPAPAAWVPEVEWGQAVPDRGVPAGGGKEKRAV
jgi:hypothetical protein